MTSGTWKQKAKPSDHGEHVLSVNGDGIGRLVLSLSGMGALAVGAEKVCIDTTWSIDGDYVTFVLMGGNPQSAYDRLLFLALEKSTRFHIDECGT